MKIAVNILRLLTSLTFILSGFVKAVDPTGTQYKLHEYAGALGISVSDLPLLITAVVLSAVEFTIGVLLLLAVNRRVVTRLALLFMAVMTAVTVWLVVADPISDCGCFGDAVKLSNTESLVKNIVLLAMTAVMAWRPTDMPRFVSRTNQWIVKNYTVLFIIAVSVWSLYDLPLFDFRPYRTGTDMRRAMEMSGSDGPVFVTTFILEKDGVRREFDIDNYPDSTWTFVDSRTERISGGTEPQISDFCVQTADGDDITDSLLAYKGYAFWLISPHIETADDTNFGDINRMYEYACEHGYPFMGITASGRQAVDRWSDMTGAEYDFVMADETLLRTMIRSNPGLILVRDGVIIRKWSHNRLPVDERLRESLDKTDIGQLPVGDVTVRISRILLWFVFPLVLLTIADRLWAWTRWVKRKKKLLRERSANRAQQIISSTFNKKKKAMRKKIVAGNWKMNMTLQEGIALATELNEALTAEKPNCDVVICTPFIHLASVAPLLDPEVIGLGAENCADKAKGAYTGEVSAAMVKSTGAQYVILGHSERREYYGETPETLKEKVLLALANGLKVIFCIGESLAEREAGKQNDVVKAELEGSVFNLSEEEFANIIIAYEPIWAIGTGKTATSEQAEEIHAYIRSIIAGRYGETVADATSILYGGSCKASNAPELFAKPDIDGGLIGGASLKAADFKGIIDAWK